MCDLGGFVTEGSGIGRSPWCGSVAGSCAATVGSVTSKWHPEFEGNLTRRLARQLAADVGVMSVSAVARREGNRLA